MVKEKMDGRADRGGVKTGRIYKGFGESKGDSNGGSWFRGGSSRQIHGEFSLGDLKKG